MEELQKQKKILEDMGYTVAYICVYGSQNYWLVVSTPEYKSDLDMKAVIIPSLDDLINETQPISTTITTEWWLCDLKDIRQYAEILCKANPVYIETLYTDYFISTPIFDEIRALRKEIIYSLPNLFVRGAFGMIMEKREALCHPYPSIKDKIEKYGYDPKQLHHIVRLWKLIKTFIPTITEPQFQVEQGGFRDTLLRLKTSPMPLEEAVKLADQYVENAKVLREWFSVYTEDYTIKDKIKNISCRIVKDSIVQKPFNKKEYQKWYYLKYTKPKRQWTSKTSQTIKK